MNASQKSLKILSRRTRRNRSIINMIRYYNAAGYKLKYCFIIVADKYYLSPDYIRDIWYQKQSTHNTPV